MKDEGIILVVGMIEEVKDDVRELKTSVERIEDSQTTISNDIEILKESPLYMVDQHIKTRVKQLGGAGGVIMLIITVLTLL